MLKKNRAPIGHDGNTLNVIHHFDQRHHGEWVVKPQTFHIQNTKLLHSTPKPNGGVNHKKYGRERKLFCNLEAESILDELGVKLDGPRL